MGKDIVDEVKEIGSDLVKATRWIIKELPKIIAALLVVLVVLAILFVWGAMSLAEKMSNPENKEFVTIASAVPLVACTYQEIEKNDAALSELIEFIETVSKTGKECGSSLQAALKCFQEADTALDNPLTIWEMAKKGKRLYKAQDEAKQIIARALARAKNIEPYDEDSTALKGEIVSFLAYINDNASILKVIKNYDTIDTELEQRIKKIQDGKNLKSVAEHMEDKYPELAAVRAASDLGIQGVWGAIAGQKIIESKPFMRSDNFSYEINNGCLSNPNEDRDVTMVGYTFGALTALVMLAPTTAEKILKKQKERETQSP